jgi:hypothetical protein
VHLGKAVRVAVARCPEDDEEDVAVVLVDLRALTKAPRVLERERMKAELVTQDLEIARPRVMQIEPEELSGGEQLVHPVALEVQPVVGRAMNEVVRAERVVVRVHDPIVRRASEAER